MFLFILKDGKHCSEAVKDLTWCGDLEAVGLHGDDATFYLVPADPRGSDEHHGPPEVGPGEQPGHLLVRRDLLPIKVLVICG